MKKLCLLVLCVIAGGLLANTQPAYGVEAFKKEFIAKYVKKDSSIDADKAFAEAVTAAKCNVCHMGKSKKMRNEYGKALSQFAKKKDAKNIEKLQEALEKAAALKSNPDDPNSPTFGELIAQGKLPGGEVPASAAADAGDDDKDKPDDKDK